MAINIISAPLLIQPVYNPLYLKVSSDKITEEAFNFIFDTYINGEFINRSRLLQRPGTNEAIFSPARVIESYLSYDLSHNITTDIPSTNCVDNYTVVCGEEYVSPWRFFDNEAILSGPYSGYLSFRSSGTTENPFVIGDSIFVQQDAGYSKVEYNGTFTVVSSTTDTVIVNALHQYTTPVNPGVITYSDRRKTIYTGATEFLFNPQMTSSFSGWTLANDGHGNTLTQPSNTLKLTVDDMTSFASLGYTFISTATTANTLIPGNVYNISINVSSITGPGAYSSYVQPIIGGTIGTGIYDTGVTSQNIVCGTGSTFQLKFYSNGSPNVDDYTIVVDYAQLKNINGISSYAFNGTAQYEDIPTWNYSQYYLSGTTSKFLTNQPSTVYTTLEDRGSIGCMRLFPYVWSDNYHLLINIENNTGNVSYDYILSFNVPLTTNGIINEIPAYPWNLNNLGFGEIITENTIRYSFFIYKEQAIGPEFTPVSEKKIFVIDDCSKYEKVRFMFLNTLGQFDYFNATLVSRENINISRTGYQKVLPYNYAVGDRGRTNLNIEAQQSYTVVSNWISEETCNWLMELFTSIEVYVINDDGSLMPVIIDNSSVENKKRVNDGMLNYTFNYSKAVMKNTLRG